MGIGQAMQSIAELLGSGEGSLVLGIAALIAIGAPFADRYVIRRKRLTFRVLYNSKIGLTPVDLNDDAHSAKMDPHLKTMARQLSRMSIVVIRIRNTGSFDIDPDDFETPISFTFGDRIVWDARISEATTDDLRQLIRENMEFFSRESTPDVADREKLSGVRSWLPQRLAGLLGSQDKEKEPEPPQLHGVRLTRLSLKRSEKFKLVVVLREPGDNGRTEISKDVTRRGRISGGRIKDEKQQRRLSWPVVTGAVGVLLTGALIATLLTASRPVDPAIRCADGTIRVEGSTVFTPIVGRIAQKYTQACSDATVTAQPTGSIDGVRALAALPAEQRGELAVLSDGRGGEQAKALVPQAVAVIVFGVVVNTSAGVDRLTTEQLRDIFQGRIRDWNQLRPGPSMPIRLVGRGQESGSRQAFETEVLGGTEGGLSSDSCERPERDAGAATVRCERSSTSDVLAEIAATPGAIGYADVPAAKAATAGDQSLTTVRLDGREPDVSVIAAGYPFWTIEYLYTKGVPDGDSLLKNFLDYLRGDAARAELQEAGYTPCVGRDGSVHPLCAAP
ncbi:PstS family phosphate ABC transporter substrate-binding protein [Amycolatopsis suaedae]|uniref:Phosphate-binding protein n=1 Tax=Amycolatopsis suaedae TaxID=2510978 RepID=A0A4Q7J7B7_9PSEU|nr:substrate-binding domain-containing protein [Amycolatopsis suaedae]RZQ63560.1 phosphate-binding protein [Amycolatopsis suaedae]